MNASEARETRRLLAKLHADLNTQYGDAVPGSKDHKRLAADIDSLAKLYNGPLKKLAVPTPKKEAPKHQAGTCPCGAPIMISDRYTANLKSGSFIKVACPGKSRYEPCTRTNELRLSASTWHVERDWHVLDCMCGAPVYLRDADGGGRAYGLKGWVEKPRGKKVTEKCRGCGCEWKFTISFVQKDGSTRRRVNYSVIPCHQRHREAFRERHGEKAS